MPSRAPGPPCSTHPTTRILGVTATPERLDGKGLADQFDDLVCGPSVRDLTEAGYLAPARILSSPVHLDLSAVKTVGGDFAIGQLAEAMSSGKLIGDAVQHYTEHGAGRAAIAFCVTVGHAEQVAARFRAAGYRAASVDGSMRAADRDAVIGGLADGSLELVTSCQLISEGLDIPNVGAAILLRPTQSLALYLQQVGRALRPKPDGSAAILLDHAGNAVRHGHPSEPRVWTLDGRQGRGVKPGPGAESPPGYPEAAAGDADLPEELAGRLIELSAGEFDAYRLRTMRVRDALAICETDADVRRLGRLRGYRPGWAYHALRERAGATA
jgi:superfamily II DNA or RNA helicase